MAGNPGSCGPILIVDDDEGFRAFLSTLLENAGHVARQAASGEEALEATRRERPGAVVLDVRLPGISGYEVCRELRNEFGGDLPILFVSGERTESFDRVAGLLVGGDDYLVKPFAPDELLARMRGLLRRFGPAPPVASKLTKRELDVLRLLAGGLGPAAIAHQLVISPKTVRTHIQHILHKLGVHSRVEAVAVAYRDDLVGR